MNIKIFKDKKPNINKLIFFGLTPTYSTYCPKSIISHFITGNKLYEIMKHNRINNLKWIVCNNYIYKYDLDKIPKKQNIIRNYIRKIPNRTPHVEFLEKYGIEILGNLKDRNNRNNYITNKKLKKICKWNGLHGYSHLRRKDLIRLLMKI